MDDKQTAAQDLYRFAIQEGIRALQHQEAELSRMRDRAIAMAGLTATAAAFLVGAALHATMRGPRFYIPMTIGSVGYLVLLGLCWLLLKPVNEWSAKVSGTVILDDFASREPPEAYRLLAGFYESARVANESVLVSLRTRLVWALICAGGTVAAFLTLTWLVAN